MKKIALVSAAALALVLSGCSMGGDGESNENPEKHKPTNAEMGIFKLGDTHKYEDGLSATAKLKGYVDLDEYSASGMEKCFMFNITIKNEMTKPFKGYHLPESVVSYTIGGMTHVAQIEYTGTEEDIPGIFPRILPGSKATTEACFAIPSHEDADIDAVYVDLTPDDTPKDKDDRKPTYWYDDGKALNSVDPIETDESDAYGDETDSYDGEY